MRFFAYALLVILASACSNQSTTQETKSASDYSGPPVKNDWYMSRLPSNPESLNDIIASDAYSSSVTAYLFESLVSFDVQTGEPVPRVAESWTVSDDGLVYDFKIRKGVKFHDGKELSVEDVKYSFDLIKDPKVNAPHLQNYYESLKKVEITGPDTVRMTMSKPYFRNIIMLGLLKIYPKHLFSVGNFNSHPLNRKPIASGPYKFVKWIDGSRIELERFEDWWGNDDPYWKDRFNFNKVQFKIITEDAVSIIALKNGDIDAMSPNMDQFLNALDTKEIKDNYHRLQYSTSDGAGFNYIGFNLRRKPFDSIPVRRALAMSMPRQQLNENLYQGKMKLAVAQYPQGSPKTHPDIQPIEYDLGSALEILEKEGWSDSDGDGVLDKDGQKFEFELLIRAQHEIAEKYALAYQSSLERLQIKMNIRRLEWTVMLKTLDDRKFDTVMIAWGASLDGDPYQIWHSSQSKKGGSNYIGYKNARVDEIVEKGRSILDREERNKLYREMTKIIADEAPYLFLYESPQLGIVSKRFSNVLPIGELGLDSSAFFTPPGMEKYQDTATAK